MILYWSHRNYATWRRCGAGLTGVSYEGRRPTQVFLTEEEISHVFPAYEDDMTVAGNLWREYYMKELLGVLESKQARDIIIAGK